MEYDREVLEFFDQPYQLELHYQGPSGRPTKALHTPDFLVLHKDGASFEEWKPEEKLLELMVTHPGRYQRDERGKWRCPPGVAAAESLGLSYRVRSSEELHPGYIRNLTLSANALLDWDGKRWTLLNLGKATTTLLPEEGTLIQLETPVFLHLIDTHVIQVKDTSQSPTMALSAEVHRLLIEAGDEALEVANQRYLLVEAYQNKQQEIYAGTPTRSIRDWLTNFRDAEAAYGYGYVGLLPKTAARGNREPKVTEERRRLLDEAIAQWLLAPNNRKSAMSLCSTRAPAWSNISNLSANGLFIGM